MKRTLSIQPLLYIVLPGALAVGAALALFTPVVAIGVLAAIAGAVCIFWDYRAGLVASMLLAPISSDNNLLKAFSALVLLTSVSFVVTRLGREKSYVFLPKKFVWLYCVPYLLAYVAALTQIYLPYRAINDPTNRELYTEYGYFAAHLLPALSYIALIVLLGNAVATSENKENWIKVYCVATIIASITFLAALIGTGYSITALNDDRNIEIFFSHPNDWGAMLGTAAGTLLFLSVLGSGRIRLIATISLAFVLTALALAFSRGGYLSFLVAVAGMLLVYRRLKVILALVVIALVSAFFLPDQVIERATLGMDISTITSAEGGSMTDELTAGRGGIFVRIVPEIWGSPIVGRGLGGMAWTDTYLSGRLDFTNPHDLYVEILLDTGFVGLLLFGIWIWDFLRTCRRVSADVATPKTFSIFFQGLGFAFLGFLAMGVSNGHWFPRYEQSFLWMGFGMLLAFWKTQTQPSAVGKNLPGQRGIGAGSVRPGLSTGKR